MKAAQIVENKAVNRDVPKSNAVFENRTNRAGARSLRTEKAKRETRRVPDFH
jgi:hypothetical protein